MILDHLNEVFPPQPKPQFGQPASPNEDNFQNPEQYMSEDDALKDPTESSQEPESMQVKQDSSSEVPMSETLPGDSTILCVEQQPDGLYYYFKVEEGEKETSKVGPFLLNFQQEIQRILQQVADNVKSFKADGMTLVATGDFQGEAQGGQPQPLNKWEVGNYSNSGAKRLADLLNSWLQLRKTLKPDFSKAKSSEGSSNLKPGDLGFEDPMQEVDDQILGRQGGQSQEKKPKSIFDKK